MSKFKHTPGPWTALIEGESTWGSDSHSVVAGEHFAGVADVMIECEASTHGEDGVTHVTQEHGIANARLIAAAPDLLEALIAVLAYCVEDEGQPTVATARAAIAKATGAGNE